MLNQRLQRDVARLAERRREEILHTPDELTIAKTVYYVANAGCDSNDGLTPETAWQSLQRVSEADLQRGDGVLFCRGDLFRGCVRTKPGVTYGAYGEGPKPRIYGWDKPLANPALWELVNAERRIWRLKEPILDPGTLVFNDGEKHSRKLIPSYIGGQFVCRDDESRPFDMAAEMKQDLDLYWHFDAALITRTQTVHRIPDVEMAMGELYLRCDGGNPGDCFRSVEALTRRPGIWVRSDDHVRIDNLCLKYIGHHAVAAGGHVVGLHVTNCEIGWIGGTIQYYADEPHRLGRVTRFGNGVEIYGGCEDYRVANCYVYEVYDAGITHQISTGGKKHIMTGVRYENNLVERCVYSIEYFLTTRGDGSGSYMDDILMRGNILRMAGYGWGRQRPDPLTPAHIKSWNSENPASRYRVEENVFDRSTHRLLHVAAETEKCLPAMRANAYIQYRGGILAQYGGRENGEPDMLRFDEGAEDVIRERLGDAEAGVCFADE